MPEALLETIEPPELPDPSEPPDVSGESVSCVSTCISHIVGAGVSIGMSIDGLGEGLVDGAADTSEVGELVDAAAYAFQRHVAVK